MKLVIGGYAQGKLDYVLLKYHLSPDLVQDGVVSDEATFQSRNRGKTVVINHFHEWVKRRILEGGCPEEEMYPLLESRQEPDEDCIIISDEVGNGIVPVDPFEREYRERLGRILIQIADRAEEVERVICGIGQKIK